MLMKTMTNLIIDNIVASFKYKLPITYVKNTSKQFISSNILLHKALKKAVKKKVKCIS